MNRIEMAEQLREMAEAYRIGSDSYEFYNQAAAMLEAPALDCGPGEWVGMRDKDAGDCIIRKKGTVSILCKTEIAEQIAATLDRQPVKWEE